MPRAGFYAVESGKISFRADGNWYSDDERIDNPRIASLFSKSLHRDPAGGYFLKVAEERAPVMVEDTPYVVKALEEAREGGGFVAITNDDEREALDLGTLEVGAHNVLYCRVKHGEFRARFLRSAYYHLSRHFSTDEHGRYFVSAGDRRFALNFAASHDNQGDS